MRFRSPWQTPLYARAVALLRLVLRPFGQAENRFINGLTRVQNRRVHRHLAGRQPARILLILPRCVKRRGCCADVKGDLDLCRDCRDCPLGDIARLCARYGVRALVAYRSHIAFAMARRERPDLIVATACHDRLVKALSSVPEFPALLAPLSGMEKMCVNADIDLVWFERQLQAVTRRAGADSGVVPEASPVRGAVGAP